MATLFKVHDCLGSIHVLQPYLRKVFCSYIFPLTSSSNHPMLGKSQRAVIAPRRLMRIC